MPKEERVKKKKWATPQLIVLVRGKPEEGVLVSCKGNEGGPISNALSCIDGYASVDGIVCDASCAYYSYS